MSITLSLEPAELQALVNILANTTGVPWTVSNPLLVKISQQTQGGRMPGAPPNGEDMPRGAEAG